MNDQSKKEDSGLRGFPAAEQPKAIWEASGQEVRPSFIITDRELQNWFTYHPPGQQDQIKYVALRDAALAFARMVVALTPACPDQTAAVRRIREAVMIANQSIACGGK